MRDEGKGDEVGAATEKYHQKEEDFVVQFHRDVEVEFPQER